MPDNGRFAAHVARKEAAGACHDGFLNIERIELGIVRVEFVELLASNLIE